MARGKERGHAPLERSHEVEDGEDRDEIFPGALWTGRLRVGHS